MSAYCLFDILEVVDPKKFEEYKNRVVPLVEHFGGRYVVAGGRFDVVEGNWRPKLPVMIEFPNLEDAHRWYSSKQYRELKELRLSAAKLNAVFMEGVKVK